MLAVLPADGWVAQIIKVLTISPALLITDQSSVRLCSWHGDVTSMQVRELDIPIDKKASMRRLVVQGSNVMFVRSCSIVIMNLDTFAELRSISIDCKDLVLLASGSRYLLITMWESCQKNSRLAIVDSFTGDVVGSYPIPL